MFLKTLTKTVNISTYLCKYKNKYTKIRICVSVIVLVNIVDYNITTVYDMRNEKNYFYHYNVFEHILDFEILNGKIVAALLIFETLYKSLCS